MYIVLSMCCPSGATCSYLYKGGGELPQGWEDWYMVIFDMGQFNETSTKQILNEWKSLEYGLNMTFMGKYAKWPTLPSPPKVPPPPQLMSSLPYTRGNWLHLDNHTGLCCLPARSNQRRPLKKMYISCTGPSCHNWFPDFLLVRKNSFTTAYPMNCQNKLDWHLGSVYKMHIHNRGHISFLSFLKTSNGMQEHYGDRGKDRARIDVHCSSYILQFYLKFFFLAKRRNN